VENGIGGVMKNLNVTGFPVACPCGRGYLYLLVTQSNGVPVVFGLYKGVIVIQGYCDTCTSLLQYSCPLADMLFNEPEEWNARTKILKQGRLVN